MNSGTGSIQPDRLAGILRRADITGCRRHRHLLSEWERTFLDGLPRFPRLTPKQQESLDRIVTKLRVSGFTYDG
jgi:hypothetical protein